MSAEQRRTADPPTRPDEEHPVAGTGVPSSPDNSRTPDNAAEPVRTPPHVNCDSTLDPANHDPFDESGVWDDRAPTPAGPVSEDAQATYAPEGASDIADVWGDDFGDADPCSTLKAPGERAASRPPGPINATRDVPAHLTVRGYTFRQVIGEGGVGIVYRAVQDSIERDIAIKMIKPGAVGNAEERAKFVSEAKVTGDLDHPNIVPIHDLGTTSDGQPFYTMKLVRGTPWNELIRHASESENLRVLLDVCDAVAFAHAKGVIHRDLKPENVMLGEFGEVQVMDWGLGASVSEQGKAIPITQTQPAGGTPAYMAPEMVTGEDGPVGIHSDIYLLGAILYEIITGKPPHAGRRVMDCLDRAARNVIEPTEETGVLLDIALKAMSSRPCDRYPDVQTFKQALLDYQTHAQSIRQAQQAAADLRCAQETQEYDTFAQALFGFREALKLWSQNAAARDGVHDTELAYARCAYDKGDLDLAASLLDPCIAEHRTLREVIAVAEARRAAARRRLVVLKRTAIGLTLTVIATLTVASIWISASHQREKRAKEAALDAKEAEAEQRRVAEVARLKAEAEEARAKQARNEMEKAIQAMMVAKTQKEQAKAQAQASELVAKRTRDQLARSGMLLDNSWWTFDADTARSKQEAAAAPLNMPVTLEIDVGDVAPLVLTIIPPGEFVMGSPPKEENRAADEYLHRVRHTDAFYLGVHELTAAQWHAIVNNAPPETPAADVPMTGVTPSQIDTDLLPALQRFAPPGYVFRLPTEAEWEYACRAGCATAYHAGDTEDDLATIGWFLGNADRRVQPIGQKSPNAFGLYDLHGNVSEICTDHYDPSYYLESPTENPLAQGSPERRVVRGGSVLNTAAHCRTAYRSYVYDKNEYEFVGLRLALVPIERRPTPTTDQSADGN